jgi:hypothetical protein
VEDDMPNPVLLHRAIAIPATLAAGTVLLPFSALAVEGITDRIPGELPGGDENYIAPVWGAATIATGAGIGALLPGLAGANAGHGKGALVGAALGVCALVAGGAAWFAMLGG